METRPRSGQDAVALRSILIGIALVVALIVLWTIRNILILVTLAVLLAYALDPLVTRLERIRLPRRRHLPRSVASGIVIVGLVVLGAWAIAVGVPRLFTELSGFLQRLPTNLQVLAAQIDAWAVSRGIGAYVSPSLESVRSNAATLAPQVGRALLGWVATMFGNLVQILGLLVLPLLSFYLLAEREAVQASLQRFLPSEARNRVGEVASAVDRALKSYVRGQAVVCFIMGGVVGIVLTAIGFPNGLLLGALVGAAEVIPYVGFAIAALAIGIAGFGEGIRHALLGIAAYTVVNNLVGFLVTPRVMGRYLKMHPFLVTVSVLAGAELLGPAGVLLALPGAAVIQSLVEEFATGRPSRREPA